MNDTSNVAEARYSLIAMAFHWLLAALVFLNFFIAWSAEDLPDAEKGRMMGNHMAVGLTVLMLTVLRVAWRIFYRPPPLVETLKAWEVALARVTHFMFYVLMLALPLAGLVMVSAFSGGHPVSYFGLFDFPGLPLAKDKAMSELFHELHEVFATLMLLLIVLHLAAALKHLFVDRDATMRRMLPWGR